MGSVSKRRMHFIHHAGLVALICGIAGAAWAQAAPTGQQTDQPQAPETAKPSPFGASGAPIPGVAMLGPSREIKLAENTWFRFAVQVQAWAQARQDRLSTGTDGSYGYDFFCRRCRFFATGSVVKNVFFNFLFEGSSVGKADTTTGAKNTNVPNILDAYGQVKFADAFWVSAGSILMPLSRNGTQPTTTYLTLDGGNAGTTPILQGNSFVQRDLGFQVNGFFNDNHIEYRVGAFQGSRQPSTGTAAQVAAGTASSAGHNAPRFVGSLLVNFLDPEVGYVNGGHYYGTKRVLGVMGTFDYQALRKDGPGFPIPGTATNQPAGTDKNAYWGYSLAAFMNLPLAGPSKTGGDEIAALAQFGSFDGGFRQNSVTGAAINPGTYPNTLKQQTYLAELAYYNHTGKFSVFGKFEKRKVSDDYIAALKSSGTLGNVTWYGGGLKYYIAPANLMNLTLQYERAVYNSVDLLPNPANQQDGTNTVTLAWQTLLY